MVDLEESESQIPNAWSVIITFSLITTFYPTKNENRTKKSSTQPSYYWLKKKLPFWSKTADCLQKVRGSCQHKVYFLALRMLLYLRAKLQVSRN